MLRRITLHQLRLFAALARTMNMTRAAEELHMTPSAFSIQIKQLAESFGVPLHEQVGKKLFLTEAGRAVATAAREISERLDLLGMEIADMQGFKRGTLRVAMITTARYFATRLIGDFCRAYKNITFELEVVNREQILQRMRDNLDDLYIMGLVPEELDVVAFPVAENPLVVIAPADHPLCGEKRIAPQRLAQEPFILREAGSGTRQAIERFFERHWRQPADAHEPGLRRDHKTGGGGGPRPHRAVASRAGARRRLRRLVRTRRSGFSDRAAMVCGPSPGEKTVAARARVPRNAQGQARRRGDKARGRWPRRRRSAPRAA